MIGDVVMIKMDSDWWCQNRDSKCIVRIVTNHDECRIDEDAIRMIIMLAVVLSADRLPVALSLSLSLSLCVCLPVSLSVSVCLSLSLTVFQLLYGRGPRILHNTARCPHGRGGWCVSALRRKKRTVRDCGCMMMNDTATDVALMDSTCPPDDSDADDVAGDNYAVDNDYNDDNYGGDDIDDVAAAVDDGGGGDGVCVGRGG